MSDRTARFTSARALFMWVTRRQLGNQVKAFGWSLFRMAAIAALPIATGLSVQEVMNGSMRGLALTGLLVLALGLAVAVGEVMLHRATILNWIVAVCALQRLVGQRIAALGGVLATRLATGEVVSVSTIDIGKIASLVDSLARCIAAALVTVLLCGYLMANEPQLGLLVMGGLCLVVLSGLPFLQLAAKCADAERSASGRASALASDTVAGLRVLRGIGGERLFLTRYRQASQRLRTAAVRNARTMAGIEVVRVAASGLLLVAVIWSGARFAAAGRIDPGQLISAYGVVVYLLVLLQTIQDSALRLAVTHPALKRVTGLFAHQRTHCAVPTANGEGLSLSAALSDPLTGLVAPAGKLTAVVCAEADEAEQLAARLGGHPVGQLGKPSALLGHVALNESPVETVRAAVILQDKNPFLFSGTLRDLFDVPASGRVTCRAALEAARCQDVLEVLAREEREHNDPMLAEITSRGRSLSGGQRQRLALARSLFADSEVLVLDEPTSAVDSHTEAQIARSLRKLRDRRTTVVFTSSPALLDQADLVVFLREGRVITSGIHRELLRSVPDYHTVVARVAGHL